MGIQEKRVKIYQITNNVTDDMYIGSTTEALYRRLSRHKRDAKNGCTTKLCNLMGSQGLDKFKIDVVEEGVFPDVDSVRAWEKALIQERGCTLNEEASIPDSTPHTPYRGAKRVHLEDSQARAEICRAPDATAEHA